MRLSLLLPAWKHVLGGAVLARWTARADRAAGSEPGRNTALRECFAVEGDALPIAALTRSIDAGDAPGAVWLRADPAFVMADAVTLRLLACGNLALSAEEVAAFVHALAPTFAERGLTLDAPHPQRWYLRGLDGMKLPTFSPPEDALGDDLGRHLPEGDDARRWRGLLNEVQIVLTQHPSNAQRARRGLPPVNSLWFWGAGVLPQAVSSDFAKVYSSDEVVVALAKLAKVEWSEEPGEAREWSLLLSSAAAKTREGNDGDSALIDLARYRDTAQLESDWLAPIAAAVNDRRVGRLDLCFESGERYVVKPLHRWRFWRSTKTDA